MSTEIEPYQPRAEVDSWSAVMPSVVKLAEYVQDTEFIPKTLRNRPAAIAAAILSGREMGIGPMRALSHVHMIEGRPSLSAEQKRAAALAAGHEIAYVESTTTRCTVRGRRNGSDQWSTVTWTADDAKLAGLAGRENWRKHPRRMLQARATGELVDLLFPDASAGLATTEELVDDTDSVEIRTDGQAPPKKRTARRQTVVTTTTGVPPVAPEPVTEKPEAAPPLPGEDGYETVTTTPIPTASEPTTTASGDGITRSQLTKLHVVFSKLDYHDRDDRLRAAAAIVGRPLNSSTELTREEAIALIDTLEAIGNRDALEDLLAQVAIQETFDAEIVEDEG